MQLKLRVIGGKNDGREMEIKVPEFIIGRGEGVNLRPKSDLISRHHCAVLVEDGQAFIKDLDSRNGTFLNGEQISEKIKLKVGDRLRVGRLQFEVLIDHGQPGQKKPKVTSIKEAAQRTADKTDGKLDEDSITDWLFEAEETEKSRQNVLETRQFRIDETDRVVLEDIIGNLDAEKDEESVDGEADLDTDASGEGSRTDSVDTKPDKKKKKPGKLPQLPRNDSVDSKDAASDTLRKFFNRR